MHAPPSPLAGSVTGMSRCPTIETERLVMRPFAERDLDAYVAILQSEPVRSAFHLPETIGRWDAWSQMAAWLGQWELRGTGHWALQEKATGSLVGRAGLHHPARDDWPGVEVGWTLHPDHWGRGYARGGPTGHRLRPRRPRSRPGVQRDPSRERPLHRGSQAPRVPSRGGAGDLPLPVDAARHLVAEPR